MDIERFRRLPLLGILRGITADDIEPLAAVIADSGLEAVEVTMNTQGATSLIRQLTSAANGRFMIGAGTVLSTDNVKHAVDAGASFIVMPVCVAAVVEHCATAAIPVFPGALTPQEIFTAWKAGATMVKVFPASCFGPAYFKEIKGPFAEIELLAVGGVSAENVADYFACGAAGVAFGSSIFRGDWLRARHFDRIADAIRTLIEAVAAARRRARAPGC